MLYKDSFHEIKWRSNFLNCRAMFDIYTQRLLTVSYSPETFVPSFCMVLKQRDCCPPAVFLGDP